MKQSIGERITISKKNDEIIIRIDGTVEEWMNHALLGWLILWTLTGLYVVYFLSTAEVKQEQLFFFLTYLTFWGYFEYKSVYSWLFRVRGYELVKITPDALLIKKAVFSFGKVQRYVRENIKEMRKLDQYDRSLAAVYNKSFWVVGNEQVVFKHLGKNVGVGMHLTEKDTVALMAMIKKALKKK